MRISLLNHQPELESYETQKTSQLKAMTRIIMAIFIMLLTPQVSWAVDYELWIGNTQITDANRGDIKSARPDSIENCLPLYPISNHTVLVTPMFLSTRILLLLIKLLKKSQASLLI